MTLTPSDKTSTPRRRLLGLSVLVVAPVALLVAIAARSIRYESLAAREEAIADAKDLIADITKMDDKGELTAHRIATRRASDEGREGIAAFLGKRKPHWTA